MGPDLGCKSRKVGQEFGGKGGKMGPDFVFKGGKMGLDLGPRIRFGVRDRRACGAEQRDAREGTSLPRSLGRRTPTPGDREIGVSTHHATPRHNVNMRTRTHAEPSMYRGKPSTETRARIRSSHTPFRQAGAPARLENATPPHGRRRLLAGIRGCISSKLELSVRVVASPDGRRGAYRSTYAHTCLMCGSSGEP